MRNSRHFGQIDERRKSDEELCELLRPWKRAGRRDEHRRFRAIILIDEELAHLDANVDDLREVRFAYVAEQKRVLIKTKLGAIFKNDLLYVADDVAHRVNFVEKQCADFCRRQILKRVF